MAARSPLSKFRACLRWLLLCASLSSLIACTSFTPIFSEGIRLTSEQRTQAEGYVRIVNRLRAEGRITKRQHSDAEILYRHARLAFNTWIDQLEYDLEEGYEASEEYQSALKETAVKADKFIGQVYRLSFNDAHSQILAVVPNLDEPLTQAGMEISREYRRGNSEHQKGIVQTLETLKWRPFGDISNEA